MSAHSLTNLSFDGVSTLKAAAIAGGSGGGSGSGSGGAAAAAAATTAANPMSVWPQATPGTKVWVVNLISAKALNGEAAVVLPPKKQVKANAKGRIAIEILSSKKQLTALPANLVTADPMG
jgi:hypothetical protein